MIQGDKILLDDSVNLRSIDLRPALVQIHHILHQQQPALLHFLLAVHKRLLYYQSPLMQFWPQQFVLHFFREEFAAESAVGEAVGDEGLEDERTMDFTVVEVILYLAHGVELDAEI